MLRFLWARKIGPEESHSITDSSTIPIEWNLRAPEATHVLQTIGKFSDCHPVDKAKKTTLSANQTVNDIDRLRKTNLINKRENNQTVNDIDRWRRTNLINKWENEHVSSDLTSEKDVLIQAESYRHEIALLRKNLKRSRQIVQKLRDEAVVSNKRASDADCKVVVQAFVSQMNLLVVCDEHEVESKITQSAIDSLNIELEEKDRKCIVAMLASERLQSQLDTERFQVKSRAATLETEMLRSICSNVAHDLKTPLHTIMMVLESLRCSFVNFDIHNRDLLDTLDSATAFMGSAVGRAVDFTKSSSGIKLDPSSDRFNFADSLRCPVKWMNSMLPADSPAAITLGLIPSVISTIITDRHWMEDNLLCLLSNAIKYSSQSIVNIMATIEGEGNMIRITVEDNGVGVSEESKSLLFKQYLQAERVSVGGTGLGLFSLSKRSEALGGSCGVKDRADGQQGSAFWFEFPYQSGEFLKSDESSPTDIVTMAMKPLRILLVDDSITVVKVLSKKLETYGHCVITAKNGAEGLHKMVSMNRDLDLIIMDVQMPVMDGIEATRLYREMEGREGLTHFPIICSSANSDSDTRLRATAAGVDSFLPKPFNMENLLDVLSGMVARTPAILI